MNLKERNYAGDHVVVGSLEVLGDVKGGKIQEIKRNIDLIQQQAEVVIRTQNRYWEELSSDSIITPLEKQQLLKEVKSIQNSYTAIYTQALSVGQESSSYVQDYIATYNDLYSYLYTTLHLFDDMEAATDIENRQTFNTKFYNYYYSESFVLVALSKGLLDSVSIRVLDSLLDEGEEGDVGIYHGALYQYVNGAWKNVSTGNYKGALDSLPADEQDAFFLCSDNFVGIQELYVNGEQLQINDGNGLDALGISRLFRKGYIYYCQDNSWYEQQDKTNYMYVAAFADVLNITGELPQIFQDAIDDLQTQINNNKVPRYRGPSATNPENPVEGDYFVYSGTSTVTRRNSDIYRYEEGEWVRLDPSLSQNGTLYMSALEDILQLRNADNGYFAALFAQTLIANQAFMDALTTKIITLQAGQGSDPGGYIQSDNYDPNNPEGDGFRVDYDGNADFNGDTHVAGKVAIGVPLRGNSDFNDFDVVIGGNTKISGKLAGVKGTMSGDLTVAGFEIAGVEPGNSILKTISLPLSISDYFGWEICGSGTFRIQGDWTGYIYIEKNNDIIFDHRNEGSEGSGHIAIDISITAGDAIKVNTGMAGGAIAYSGSFEGGIYTKYPCSILTFLGKMVEGGYTPGPSPR